MERWRSINVARRSNQMAMTAPMDTVVTTDPITPPTLRLLPEFSPSESSKTPGGMLARLDALENETVMVARHVNAIVAHLIGGGAPSTVPATPPEAPPAPDTVEEIGVAAALAALTPEQKAALRSLLGG
jgi:hypothetical protein